MTAIRQLGSHLAPIVAVLTNQGPQLGHVTRVADQSQASSVTGTRVMGTRGLVTRHDGASCIETRDGTWTPRMQDSPLPTVCTEPAPDEEVTQPPSPQMSLTVHKTAL